jgi:hypothetical protein
MNAQAENERNKAQEREADFRERYVSALSKESAKNPERISNDYRIYDPTIKDDGSLGRDVKNRTEAMKAQNRYGEIQKRYENQTAQRKSMNAQAETERNKVAEAKEDRERRSDQYWQEREWAIEGYYKLIKSMTGKDIREVSNFYDVNAKKTKNHQPGGKEPDAWATLTDKKTGKTFTVPSFEEYYQIAKKNKDASNKNAINGIQQKYGSLTKGNAPVSNTPKVSKEYLQELEYNSRKNVFPEGFKTRPATAADADLFKNKSSAETKNKVTISGHGGNTGIKTEVTKKKKRRL